MAIDDNMPQHNKNNNKNTTMRMLFLLVAVVAVFLPGPPGVDGFRPPSSSSSSSSTGIVGRGVVRAPFVGTQQKKKRGHEQHRHHQQHHHHRRSRAESALSSSAAANNNNNNNNNNDGEETTTTTSSSVDSGVRYEPVFDFSGPDKESVVAKFDRIDDAIMGGISTSSIRPGNADQPYAIWSGFCRTDGGGFCGTRTLPFRDGVPLRVTTDGASSRDGFYLTVRLVSDNEPERRVWKLTTRVENVQRSEQLYQTDFEIPKQVPNGDNDGDNDDDDDNGFGDEWKTILVPFDGFVQVRGPRIVPNGPPLDVSGGLYQVGMTMSKFQLSSNVTEKEDFRPGFFELHIRDIGLYTKGASLTGAAATPAKDNGSSGGSTIDAPVTLTKTEAEKNKPLALKILFPILKLFFSEQRNRRKSAARILRTRWGLGRLGIARFGFRRKAASRGLPIAVAESLLEAVGASVRLAAVWALRIAIVYPLTVIRRTIKLLKQQQPRREPEAQSE